MLTEVSFIGCEEQMSLGSDCVCNGYYRGGDFHHGVDVSPNVSVMFLQWNKLNS